MIRHPLSLANAWFNSAGSYSDFDHKDPCLHDIGRAQAIETADFLKDLFERRSRNDKPLQLTRAFTGPLLRQMEGAGLILDRLGYSGTVEITPLLRERRTISITDEGTERSLLLAFLNSSGSHFVHQTLDHSALREEVWYDTQAEDEKFFRARMDDRRRQILSTDYPEDRSVTLAFTSAGVIHGLDPLRKNQTVNCEVIDFSANLERPETLFRPRYGRNQKRIPEG